MFSYRRPPDLKQRLQQSPKIQEQVAIALKDGTIKPGQEEQLLDELAEWVDLLLSSIEEFEEQEAEAAKQATPVDPSPQRSPVRTLRHH